MEYVKGFQTGEDKRFLLGVVTLKHWMAYVAVGETVILMTPPFYPY